jgi:hypothetical protein
MQATDDGQLDHFAQLRSLDRRSACAAAAKRRVACSWTGNEHLDTLSI